MKIQSKPDTAPARMDIFLRETEGNLKWIGESETLASARENIVQNPASFDYTFLVLDSATGEKTIIEPSEKPPQKITD